MSRDVEPIYQGWLIKSPPRKKIQIIKARWRRRYFVLHCPPASASYPGTYQLDYYDTQTLRKKKGSIDLDLCDEILAKLGSDHYQHLFSLDTKHDGRSRKYFLAADTEEEMNKWVECLCQACGFRPDTEVSEGAVVGESFPLQQTTVRPVQIEQPPSSQVSQVSQIPDVVPSQHDTPVHSSGSVDSFQDYKNIWECSSSPLPADKKQQQGSGDQRALTHVPPAVPADMPPLQRTASVDSIPEDPPPPPPMKMGPGVDSMMVTIPNSMETYDSPRNYPPRHSKMHHLSDTSDDFYKVPPSNNFEYRHDDEEEDVYKVPPSHQYYHDPEETYDVPPHRRRLTSNRDSGSSSGSRSSHGQQTYDYPPLRHSPEQPHSAMRSLEHRMRTSHIRGDSTYDVPPALRGKHGIESSLMDQVPAPPPRPPHTPPVGHDQLHAVPPVPSNPYAAANKSFPTYQNASTGQTQLSHQSLHEVPGFEMYDTPPVRYNTATHNTSAPQNTASLAPPPPPPPPPHKGPEYVNITDKSSDSHEEMYVMCLPTNSASDQPPSQLPPRIVQRSVHTESLYQAPPSNRSVHASHSPSPRLNARTQSAMSSAGYRNSRLTAENLGIEPAADIVTTNRTRSFKKMHNNGIQLPTKMQSKRTSSSATSDDSSDPDDLTARSTHPFDTVVSPKTLTFTPPAPRRAGQVQYLDLDMEDSGDPERSPSLNKTAPSASALPATDYKEIDFVKTKALSEIIQDRESKRNSSEKSVDD